MNWCCDCGERIATNGRRCHSCSNKRRTKNTCARCGREIDRTNKFCRTCFIQSKTGVPMADEVKQKIRTTMTGVQHSKERRAANSEGQKFRDPSTRFDLGEYVRGKPSPKALPVGTTRENEGRIQIKCTDGKWRNRANVMWEEKYGPVPPGYVVHHRNLNSYDDRYENFQLLTRARHARLHKLIENA